MVFAVRCELWYRRKGVLGIAFVFASQFSSQTGGEDLASAPQLRLEIKVISFMLLARVALEKFLWQLGLCTIRSDDLSRAELKS